MTIENEPEDWWIEKPDPPALTAVPSLATPADTPFGLLIALRDQQVEVDRALKIEAARLHNQEGLSWAKIGDALGVSRQAAWERFGKNGPPTS